MLSVFMVETKRDLKDFIFLPWKLYKNDPNWIPPLLFDLKPHLDMKRNPFFKHGEGKYFIVRDGKEVVGRVSAQIDKNHLEKWKERAGFFGFFESVNDQKVADRLLSTAENWLREKGCEVIRGPFSFNINDVCGILIEGHDTPPYLMMAHNPPFYSTLLEQCKYKKAKDLFAWKYTVGNIPEPAIEIASYTRKSEKLQIRSVRMQNFEKELATFIEIFNAAWAENWGFLPITHDEMKKAAKDMRMIIDPNLAIVAEYEGAPVAIALALPNLNEAIRDLNGRLFPLGIFKLIWRTKIKKLKTARQILVGIKKEYRATGKGKGLSALLYVEMHERGKKYGYKEGELSWTLEDNYKINRGIEMMGGEKYKTYRIYEKKL